MFSPVYSGDNKLKGPNVGRLDDATLSDLMRAGLAGNKDAYRSVFHSIVPVLMHMIARMAPALPPDQREDIVQDILTSVHSKSHTWQQTRPILPWIHAIARYRLIDHFRKQKRGAEYIVEIDSDRLEQIADTPLYEPHQKLDLERGVARLEGQAELVVRSIALDGKDIRQTSLETGISENAVRIVYHRGLKQLRALFKSDRQGR